MFLVYFIPKFNLFLTFASVNGHFCLLCIISLYLYSIKSSIVVKWYLKDVIWWVSILSIFIDILLLLWNHRVMIRHICRGYLNVLIYSFVLLFILLRIDFPHLVLGRITGFALVVNCLFMYILSFHLYDPHSNVVIVLSSFLACRITPISSPPPHFNNKEAVNSLFDLVCSKLLCSRLPLSLYVSL